MRDSDTIAENCARQQLLKLAHDLPALANAKAKSVSVVLVEARAKLGAIEEAAGQDKQTFTSVTAEELATGKFDLTYLIDGVLVKDQPAGLVAPKKSLKSNISIDLAIALATGGRFLGYVPQETETQLSHDERRTGAVSQKLGKC